MPYNSIFRHNDAHAPSHTPESALTRPEKIQKKKQKTALSPP